MRKWLVSWKEFIVFSSKMKKKIHSDFFDWPLKLPPPPPSNNHLRIRDALLSICLLIPTFYSVLLTLSLSPKSELELNRGQMEN